MRHLRRGGSRAQILEERLRTRITRAPMAYAHRAIPSSSRTSDGSPASPSAELCPLCEAVGEDLFEPHGSPPRANARCRECGSLERHRLAWTYFLLETDLLRGRRKKLLHFAPERAIAERLASHPKIDYLSADLNPRKAMVEMDIMAIPHPDASFDVVYCSHVLEHVDDDLRAMAELHRVLRPGGWALLVVPMYPGTTYEDDSVTDPEDRERHFGQHDHVRKYGVRDFPERIRSAGFDVEVALFSRRVLGERLAARLGVRTRGRVHMCRKPADSREHGLAAPLIAAGTSANEWTELDPPAPGGWTPHRTVSVIVPLERSGGESGAVLAALLEQTYPRALTEVVILEAGVEREPPPDLPGDLDVQRVEWDTGPEPTGRPSGEPLSAAQRAGAATAGGEILVFLDLELLPEPGYVEAHARWHHLLADAVTLGVERYADPGALTADDARAAAASRALVELLGPHECWPSSGTPELLRASDELPSNAARPAAGMGPGGFAVRAETLGRTGGSSDSAPENVDLVREALDRHAVFVPERAAIAWRIGHGSAVAGGLVPPPS